MKREANPVPALRTKGLREYHSYDGWLKAVNRINPRATMGKAGGVIQAEGIGIWNGQQGFILPSFDRAKIGGTVKRVPKHKRGVNPAQRPGKSVSTWGGPPSKRKVHSWSDSTDKNVEAKVYRLKDTDEYMVELHAYGVHRPQADYFTDDLDDAKATARSMVKRVIAVKRMENPAVSPALGMSKKAYINRKSQITKAKPDPRLKKRRNYAYLMAQRGFKGAFPNPIGEAKWQWIDYDVWGNADDGWEVNQAFTTSNKIMLKDDAKLTDMLKALRASGVLGSKATTKSVKIDDHEDAIYFEATADGYPLGELRKID